MTDCVRQQVHVGGVNYRPQSERVKLLNFDIIRAEMQLYLVPSLICLVSVLSDVHNKWCCFSTGVKNPILVADSLLRTQMRGEMSLGRIPPR